MAQYLTVYVQSRGISQEDDYRWLKIQNNSQILETPNFLNQPISPNSPSFVSLIDSHKFSLILARSQKNLILLVTGLESTVTDFMGRNIRNSLVWICPFEAETDIRALTVAALTGKLDEAIALAIVRDSSSDYGFRVDTQQLAQLPTLVSVDSHHNANPTCQLGNNSLALRQEIALEVFANCLPTTEQLLILITTIKSESDLQKIRVWRGLSSRIESSQLMPINQTVESVYQKKTLLRTAVIATAAIIALTVFLIL